METNWKKKYEEAQLRMRQHVESGIIDGIYAESIFPEFAESEDEKTLKEIIHYLYTSEGISKEEQTRWISYLGKQKESIEKEYVFRPLGGTDINIAAEQAIGRANEGERLVLAFNGAYIPVSKGCTVNKIVDTYNVFIEKQKSTDLPPGFYFVNQDGKRYYSKEVRYGDMKLKLVENEKPVGCDEEQKEQKQYEYKVGDKVRLNGDIVKIEGVYPKEQKPGWSEEEKIRKELIQYIKDYPNLPNGHYSRVDFFAYLERQKKERVVVNGLPNGCEVADDKAFEEWVDGWWEEHKDKTYHEVAMDKKEFKNFCRGIRNMYQQNSEWSAEDEAIHTRTLGVLGKVFIGNLPTKPSKEDVEWFKSLPERFNLRSKQVYRKDVWSDIDKGILKDAITAADLLGNNEDYKKEHPHLAKAFRIAKYWLKSLPERFNFQTNQEWSEEDEAALTSIIHCLSQAIKNVNDENERNSILNAKIWIQHKLKFNIPSRISLPQSKQEWSDEDELMRTAIIQTLETFKGRGTTEMQIDWLKSLSLNLKRKNKDIAKLCSNEWSEADETKLRDVVRIVENSDYVSSIKEHYKEFLTSLPERFNLPYQWSDEDEVYFQDALWCIKQASKIARGENDMGACWSAERWLKSLKDRSSYLKSNTNPPKLER